MHDFNYSILTVIFGYSNNWVNILFEYITDIKNTQTILIEYNDIIDKICLEKKNIFPTIKLNYYSFGHNYSFLPKSIEHFNHKYYLSYN